ncbi:velvet factor-domain-containing protein [Boeremia exigua]|uniref:velvet factor-domain-containing protein n=1 Tax=Boeremia exigua TaxID=749465 RepID=UPI001E8E215C|nr:velvet factor-domain-containing protein [Boeremia exigua]KAH6625865.1 velvet factor-domain-containing protein [Boeremia exigua]
MTETQKLPVFPPPRFLDFNHRRLPPPIQLKQLEIPPDAVPPRTDYQFRSPIGHLPSIHSEPPQRHEHQQPPTARYRPAVPLEKLVHHTNPYTPPRSEAHYSPKNYAQQVSPRSQYDNRDPRRLSEQRYASYDEARHAHHAPHEQPYSSLASPVEPSQQQRHYAPLPSPGYTPSYASSSTFRGSVGSYSHSQRGSVAAPLGPVAYHEPHAPGPPPRKEVRAIPLPGSIPQPVYNEQLNLNFELRVRQQPVAARACGFGERDRRVIDPPPIIQLLVTDPKTGVAEQEELRYSLNVVHCTLWNADGTNEETALIQPDRRTTRRLMGQLVASPSVAKDEHDHEGCFFCFPDLSCRTHGRYRLRFVLMRIDPMNLHVGGSSPILTEVMSDVFTVYTAKDFPGMRPSSALTRALKLQGCNIQVKKGNEKALARKRLTASQEHEEEEEMKRRRRM